MINSEIKKQLKDYPNLKKYALHFDKTGGMEEIPGYLPYLVIWFRQLFEKAGIDDGGVPELFGYDEYSDEAEDFWSWGHNSRYSNVFCGWLADDMDYTLNLAFDLMEQYELTDFDPDVAKIVKQEIKEHKEIMKKMKEANNDKH